MAELEKKATGPDKDRIVAALVTSAEKDPFWRIRRAALSVVASIYSPDPTPGQERAKAVLPANVEAVTVKLTKDPESGIRGDALRLLGETQDPKYAPMFVAALNDRSYNVIDNASNALAATKAPTAYDALVKLVGEQSWKGRIQVAGLNALADLGDRRAFDSAYALTQDKNVPVNVRTAAGAVVGTTGKGDPRAYPLVFDQFKKAYDSNNVANLIASIQAIIKVADPRGQEAFDMLKTKFKDNANALNAIGQYEAQFKAALK